MFSVGGDSGALGWRGGSQHAYRAGRYIALQQAQRVRRVALPRGRRSAVHGVGSPKPSKPPHNSCSRWGGVRWKKLGKEKSSSSAIFELRTRGGPTSPCCFAFLCECVFSWRLDHLSSSSGRWQHALSCIWKLSLNRRMLNATEPSELVAGSGSYLRVSGIQPVVLRFPARRSSTRLWPQTSHGGLLAYQQLARASMPRK